MSRIVWKPCWVLLLFGLGAVAGAGEDEGWNLPAADRVKAAEEAAARGDTVAAQRALERFEEEAKAPGTLADRSVAEARVARLRLALGRAHTRAGQWHRALPLLTAISLEGKSVAVQRTICAARLAALKPLFFEPDGRLVAPWLPAVNDRRGPHQPDPALRAPYTQCDRPKAALEVLDALQAWERLEKEAGGELSEAERAVTAALDPATRALIRYAWGLADYDHAAQAVAELPEPRRRAEALRFARLLLAERELHHAVPVLKGLLDPDAKDETARAAVEELLRVHVAYERLKDALPTWDSGVDAIVQPYLKDPVWAQTRARLVKELDDAIGALDIGVVLRDAEPLEAHRVERAYRCEATDLKGDIVVPPDILASAELGDHWETVNPETPDTHAAFGDPDARLFTPNRGDKGEAYFEKRLKELEAKKPGELTGQEKKELESLRTLARERQKQTGEKPNRYKKLGYVAGVLRQGILLPLDPKVAGQRDLREEFQLQIDHQESLVEALGPAAQKDTSKGFRPFLPNEPLRLLVLTRFHGALELEARRLPDRAAYEELQSGLKPQALAVLPVVKTFRVNLMPPWANLWEHPSKEIVEVKDPGLPPGFYVLIARARYSPVLAVTRVAVSENKLVVRHAPREVLLWSLDRRTGAPKANLTLKGELRLEYDGARVWGDTPLPERLAAGDRAAFLEGLGEALNGRANQAGSDAYLAGVAAAVKLKEKFPPRKLDVPAQTGPDGLARVALPEDWLGHSARIRVTAANCEVDEIDSVQRLAADHVERIVEWIADRPVARPGQTVRLHGFARECRNGRMSVAGGGTAPLRIELGGLVLYDGETPVDASGGCDFEQFLDPDCHDGVLLAKGQSGMEDKGKLLSRVVGGEPARRRVGLELPRHPVAAGTKVKGRVLVESAAGAPQAGVRVSVKANFSPLPPPDARAPLPFGEDFEHADEAPRAPKGVSDSAEAQQRRIEELTRPSSAEALAAWSQERVLVSGPDGTAEFEIETPEGRECAGGVTVQASGGLRATARAAGKVLSLTRGCIWRVVSAPPPRPGKPVELVLEARAPSGEPYAKEIEIADGENRILARATPGADARLTASLWPVPKGMLQARPSGGADGGWIGFQLEDAKERLAEYRGRLLAACLDKKQYQTGETARLHVRADRPNLTVLLTTEAAQFTRAEVVQIPNRGRVVEIPLGAGDAPNTTIALTALADDLVDCVLVPLDIAPAEHELTVRVAAGVTVAAPGHEVPLTVSVTDCRGAPVAGADVVVAAFDRQLLALGTDPAPEFGLPFLAAGRAPHEVGWLTGFHTFSYGCGFLWRAPEWSWGPYATGLGRDLLDAGSGRGSFGQRSGGGRRLMVLRHGGSRGTEVLSVRSRFHEQALWLTRLETGGDGKLTVPFKVPDSLTTFRIAAYALDARGYPGSATTDLPVRKDVEVGLELPDELREGDRVELLVHVWNHGEKPRTLKVAPRFPLPVLSTQWLTEAGPKPPPEALTLAPRSGASLRYLVEVAPLTLPSPPGGEGWGEGAQAAPKGEAAAVFDPGAFGEALTFEVRAMDAGGAVLDHVRLQAPLRYGGRPEREVTQGVLRSGEPLRVPYHGSFDAKHTSLTVTLRRGLKGLALDARELQFVFPEHCAEQTLSRFVPAVALADALGELKPGADALTPAARARLDNCLRSGVLRLGVLGTLWDRDLAPLAAWYLRQLAETSAGQAALRGRADWLACAQHCERLLLDQFPRDKDKDGEKPGKLTDLAFAAEPPGRLAAAYGSFRVDLWLAFGAAQQAFAARTATQQREVRQRFTPLARSALGLAHARKLLPQERALAGLLCAVLGLRTEAHELLALRDREAAPASAPPASGAVPPSPEPSLAAALDVQTALALGLPETEVLPLALKLERLVSGRAPGFGTTFLNGVGLVSLAQALRACGGALKGAAPGPVILRLRGRVVAELPAGTDLRLVTLPANTLAEAFQEGWTFELEAPAGLAAGVAVERRTLCPEPLKVLDEPAVEDRLRDLTCPPWADPLSPAPKPGEAAPRLAVRRALFVRPPQPPGKEAEPLRKWHPYAGQPVPRGTELLVLTHVMCAPGVEFVQCELPALPGWEATLWNEEADLGWTNRRDLEIERRTPGVLPRLTLLDSLNRAGGDGRAASAAILGWVRRAEWGCSTEARPLGASLAYTRLADRGARLVRLPAGPFASLFFVQAGPLKGAGRWRLPGARAWSWYDPNSDVTGAAALVQAADDPVPLDLPPSPLAWQDWLEESWRHLAQEGSDAGAWPIAGDTVDLRPLTLAALWHSPNAASAAERSHALLRQLPPGSKPYDLPRIRAQRFEWLLQAGVAEAPAEIRSAVLEPFASFDGLRQDLRAAGWIAEELPATSSFGMNWLREEQARAQEVLPWLPPAHREAALALKKATLREFAAVLLEARGGDAQAAAREWLWSRRADVYQPGGAPLDVWARELRATYGLEVRVEPVAPLVLALPAPARHASLRSYLANDLAAVGLAPEGLEPGERVILFRAGRLPGEARAALTSRSALDVPVFGMSKEAGKALRECLWLRGLQLAAPPAALTRAEGAYPTLREALEAAAGPERAWRAAEDVLEMR